MSCSRSGTQRFVNAVTACLLLAAFPAVTGCNQNSAATRLARDAETLDKENFDTNLTFNSVTLEDFDQQGRRVWKVRAKKASYSRDKKVARIEGPNGEFFQDGKAILKVSADSGEVQQDGKQVFLRGKIMATDLRDGLQLRGSELEWRPKDDVLLIRNDVTGTRKNIKATAKGGRYLTRARRLELDGTVKAESQKPNFRVNTERLVWLVNQQKLQGDRSLQMERYENNAVTDRATATQGELDLKTETVTLKQNAQLNLVDPAIQVNGNQVVWNIKPRTITSSLPITIVNAQQGFTLSGNQGNLDLKTKIFNLTGNVSGAGGPNQALLKTDRLRWNVDTQDFEANGNVTYRQANPPLNLAGPKASGRLKDQQVVVSGGRVVTEFVP